MSDTSVDLSDEENKKPLIKEKYDRESSESSDGHQGASESPNLNPKKSLL